MSKGGVWRRAAPSTTHPEPWPRWAWVFTFLSYVVLGYFLRTVVLNWIVGPLYPLLVMYVLPNAIRGRFGRPDPTRPLAPEPDLPT